MSATGKSTVTAVETAREGTMDSMTFEAPGPGSWMLDTTHHGRRPVTPFVRDMYLRAFETGFARFTERFGVPLAGMRAREVHGYMYARPVPVGEGDKPRPAPPKPVMWLVSRLHPELRRRNRIAARAWKEQRWRKDVDRWFASERDQVMEANLQFQRADPATLGDSELADHIEALLAHQEEQFVLSFVTHGGDIVPVGDLLASCAGWGIADSEIAPLLGGASPATRETCDLLAPVARAIGSLGSIPGSVEEIRGLSEEVDAAIDRWLELHGRRLLTSDDLDSPTLAERPRLQLGILTNLDPADQPGAGLDPEPVRRKVPEAERGRFDQLLADARYGLSLRDDNVGIRVNWPAGLVRRAVLECGRRMVSAGNLEGAEDALCLQPEEALALLRGEPGPSTEAVAERVTLRKHQLALDPPSHLGPEEPPPPFDILPAPMGRAAAAVMALIGAMEGSPGARPLTGTGVGGSAYTGRVCVIASPEDDFDRLHPGDVLIAPFTSPSFNSVLPLVGAIAVQEGGLLSHTAIVAREFGIPAVVGVAGLLSEIRDGEMVEVDPVEGTVRPVER